ncbi:MAG: long-chain fatty acid transporter [Nitrospirae bacterium]|nr:MAG: long-chain fatty acid transporter [Nitrospirota bacterium]
MIRQRSWFTWLSVTGLLGVALGSVVATGSLSRVHAEAFRILDQSASATGQGAAFAAQADDPSAVYFNPAGMTQLSGVQLTMGTLLIGGSIDYRSLTGVQATGNFGGAVANPPPSSVYLTANLGALGVPSLQRVTLGIGVNAPFGNLTAYPPTTPFATVLTSSALPLLDIKPTMGVKVNDVLAVGAGLDIYTFSGLFGEGQVELQQLAGPEFATGALALLGSPGDTIELNGTDTAVGFNVGLLVTPLRNERGQPLVNLAFVYRSHTTLALKGLLINRTQATTFPASADVNLPQILTWGAAVWPIRTARSEWKVEVDVDYADWSSFQNLDIRLANGLTLPKPRRWKGVPVVMVGTEYRWLSLRPDWQMALRGGYVYSQTPVPTETFTPDLPDSNYHALSVGAGWLCTGHGKFLGIIPCGGDGGAHRGGIASIGLDLAYQAILYQERTITNNVDPRVNGTWDTTIHVGALNFRVNFETSR